MAGPKPGLFRVTVDMPIDLVKRVDGMTLGGSRGGTIVGLVMRGLASVDDQVIRALEDLWLASPQHEGKATGVTRKDWIPCREDQETIRTITGRYATPTHIADWLHAYGGES